MTRMCKGQFAWLAFAIQFFTILKNLGFFEFWEPRRNVTGQSSAPLYLLHVLLVILNAVFGLVFNE